MVGVLLANIIIQPLFSLQSVFAEGEEVAIESHQEVYGVASGKCGFTTLRISKYKKPKFLAK